MEIEIENCKLDLENLTTEETLEKLIEKFSKRALESEKLVEIQKCLNIAEKSSKLLESIDNRKSFKASIITEVLSWITAPTKRSSVYAMYLEHCMGKNMTPISSQNLYRMLIGRGMKLTRKSDGEYFLPISAQKRNLLE
jgi:hypothetical protein